MVKTNARMLSLKLNLSSILSYRRYSTKIVEDYYIKIGNDNNNKGNKYFKPKEKYVKILVEDPYNNRDLILKVAKKQKGIYI